MNLALKAKYSFYSALVFFLVANPETYKIIHWIFDGLFGWTIASASGCPTPFGLFLHTAVFFCVMLGLMMFPRD
jgi:hypothetical protein